MQVITRFIQDSRGNIVSGATASIFDADTTTLATGLLTVGGNTSPNPLTSTDKGLIEFQAPEGVYDMLVEKGDLSFKIRVQSLDVGAAIAASQSAQQSEIVAEEARDIAVAARDESVEYLDETKTYVDEKTGELSYPVNLSDSKFHPIVADNDGQMALGVDEKGSLFAGEYTSKGYSLEIGDDFSIPVAVIDPEGNMPFGINSEGEVVIHSADGIGEVFKKRPTTLHETGDERFGVDINHYLMNGQSLSVRPSNISVPMNEGDLVLSSGLTSETLGTISSFEPFNYDGTSGVLYNAIQQLKFMMSGQGAGKDYSADPLYNDDYAILASSHGIAGAKIEALEKNGTHDAYAWAMNGVAEAARLSEDADRSYAVQSLIWIQGEANRADTMAAYKAKFEQMVSDYRADIFAVTSQPNTIKVITYQPSGQQTSGTTGVEFPNTIAEAFFQSAEEDSDMVISTPTYWIEHADEFHPTDSGGKQFGQMVGKVLYKYVYRDEDWQPLGPRQIDQYGSRSIVIRMNVPELPLVIDTVNVTDPGNYGFDIRDDSGIAGIVSVKVVGTDAVSITVDRDLTTNVKASYAYYGVGGNGGGPIEGARGNLRDSDSTVGADGFSKLWNWCVAFNLDVPYTQTSGGGA